ncbi:MAG: hypothetical protein ACRC0S_04845 [Fusobacteriaceae bacterium]
MKEIKWCTINDEYMNYLRNVENKIPQINYGEFGFKPFFAPLFEKGNSPDINY